MENLNDKKKLYYKDLPESIKPIIKEMCKRVKAPYIKINFKKTQWFLDYTWTKLKEDNFIEWLAYYFYNLPVSKKRELYKDTSKTKKNALKFANVVVLNYGWKLNGK